MDSSYRRTALVLPKLKAKAELLQALPELKRYLQPDRDAQTGPRRGAADGHGNSARQRAAPASGYDSDEDAREEKRLKEELRRVKRERTALLQSLTEARVAEGSGATSVQARDIQALRASLTQKQQTLNELREKNSELEQTVEALSLESRDCALLLPKPGSNPVEATATRLESVLAELEASTEEVKSRTVQYQLLADRTARDRNAAEHRMQVAREAGEAAEDDVHTLTETFHELHAAKEAAERELAKAVGQFDDARASWQRRLRDRRREVAAVERRLAEEAEERVQEAERVASEAAAAAAAREVAQLRLDAAASEENNPVVLAKLQAAEAAWVRLQAETGGAANPEQVVAAWKDLQERSTALQGLLALTRQREDRLRGELDDAQRQAASAIASAPNGAENKVGLFAASGALETSGAPSAPSADSAAALTRLRRLEALRASLELSLATLKSRLEASEDATPGQSWEKALALALQLQQEQAQQQDAAGILAPARQGRRSSVRRTSIIAPARISAVHLAAVRGFGGQRRGSIAMPLDPEASELHPTTSLHDEQPLVALASDVDAEERAPPSDLQTLVSDTVQRVERLLTLVGAQPGAEMLIPAVKFGVGTELEAQVGEESVFSPRPVMAAAPVASPQAQQFKRSTLTGPAWVEVTVAGGQQSLKAKTDSSAGTKAAAAEADDAWQQTQQAAEVAEHYIKRLVGSAVEPQPQRSDPFALESSDEDDRPVMDREAVKHRSHKITHPKPPRKGKARAATAQSSQP